MGFVVIGECMRTRSIKTSVKSYSKRQARRLAELLNFNPVNDTIYRIEKVEDPEDETR